MKPKKSLGQHFLKSAAIVKKIADAARLTRDDMVLEIGPGRGALTRALLDTGARVIAVEKDADMVTVLSKTFSKEIASKQLKLLYEDILTTDIEALLRANEARSYILVANIPYYITGQILRRFIGGNVSPSRAVLLVQKEVAERVVAGGRGSLDKARGKESILSMSVKAYGTPKKEFIVPARMFSPAPKVDSAVLSISNISRKRFDTVDEKTFFELLKKGFAQKRKQLLGNLPKSVAEKARTILKERGLPETARAEELGVDDWYAIVSAVQND